MFPFRHLLHPLQSDVICLVRWYTIVQLNLFHITCGKNMTMNGQYAFFWLFYHRSLTAQRNCRHFVASIQSLVSTIQPWYHCMLQLYPPLCKISIVDNGNWSCMWNAILCEFPAVGYKVTILYLEYYPPVELSVMARYNHFTEKSRLGEYSQHFPQQAASVSTYAPVNIKGILIW